MDGDLAWLGGILAGCLPAGVRRIWVAVKLIQVQFLTQSLPSLHIQSTPIALFKLQDAVQRCQLSLFHTLWALTTNLSAFLQLCLPLFLLDLPAQANKTCSK